MGISPFYAEAIIREHLYRPLTGTVIAIGRQTMLFTPKEAVGLFQKVGASVEADSLEVDTETSLAGRGYIQDRAFFRPLGVDNLRSLDHDAYEGADIIHDLNNPLPEHLVGIADVIIDGSTIDNVFNPAQALLNLSRMLKPGGRLISINVGSNHATPYTIPTPAWFFDFFVVNGYADCKVYACIYRRRGITVLALDPKKISADTGAVRNIRSGNNMVGLFVIAEKGDKDSSEAPIQTHYRGEQQRAAYMDSLSRIIASPRPDMLISVNPSFTDTKEAYRVIGASQLSSKLSSLLDGLKPALRKYRLARSLATRFRRVPT